MFYADLKNVRNLSSETSLLEMGDIFKLSTKFLLSQPITVTLKGNEKDISENSASGWQTAFWAALGFHLILFASFFVYSSSNPIMLASTTASMQATIVADPTTTTNITNAQKPLESSAEEIKAVSSQPIIEAKKVTQTLKPNLQTALSEKHPQKKVEKNHQAKIDVHKDSQVTKNKEETTPSRSQSGSQTDISQTPESLDTMPNAIYQVQPVYPRVALMRGQQGRVLVRFLITQNGLVDPTSIEIVETSNMAFSQSAREAVAQWRFASRSRPALVEQQVEFKLNQSL